MKQVINALVERLKAHEQTIRRLFILLLLYLIPVLGSMKPVTDPDIWWHLRTGQWIVEHRMFPWTDPFSAYGAGKAWIAYSWLFEVLVYSLYQLFGLSGILVYTVAFSLMIAAALHALVQKFEPRFVPAVTITALALGAMVPLMNPRPWLFSILLFTIEMHILLSARHFGETRRLLLLPLLFLIWANAHIQFVYGLVVLGTAAIEPFVNRILRRDPFTDKTDAIPSRRLCFITIACIFATLATPYHMYLYRTLLELALQTAPFSYNISDLLPLQFRSPADWLVLALTLGTAFILGRQHKIWPFPLLLLAAGAFISFRARRDAWFVLIVAASIIATTSRIEAPVNRFVFTKFRALIVIGSTLLAIVIVGWFRNISPCNLKLAVSEKYPVAAAAEVEKQSYIGPLYNSFGWGGYLIWRLPNLPVAIDGRTNLHGDERTDRIRKTWAGGNSWNSDPDLTAARLIIANADFPLSSLLRLDERFQLVYEDPVAMVFIHRSPLKGK